MMPPRASRAPFVGALRVSRPARANGWPVARFKTARLVCKTKAERYGELNKLYVVSDLVEGTLAVGASV